MNRKEYSPATLLSIDNSQMIIDGHKALLKTKLTTDKRKETEKKLKDEESNIAELKKQKMKVKQRQHGLAY